MNVKESDWKLFRKNLPGWQERYMCKLIEEYIEELQKDVNPSERFWTIEQRIKKDKRKAGVMVQDMSRSHMIQNIIRLLNEKAITEADLVEFSEDLKTLVKQFYYQ